MARYLQLERYLNKEIQPNQIIQFDIEVAHSQSKPIIDPDLASELQSEPEPTYDFSYPDEVGFEGAITLLKTGDYLIMWGINQLTERPIGGEFFQLKRWNPNLIIPAWEPLSGPSTHLKAIASTGFTILSHTSSTPMTVALFNVSNETINISENTTDETPDLKARIFFYGLSEDDGDFTRILSLLEVSDECLMDLDTLENRIKCLERGNIWQDKRIDDLLFQFEAQDEEFEENSTPSTTWTFTNSRIAGMTIYCKRTGSIYYFWSEGTFTTGFRTESNTPYYFLTPSEFFAVTNDDVFGRYLWPDASAPMWIRNGNQYELSQIHIGTNGLFYQTSSTTQPSDSRGREFLFDFSIVLF